MVLKFTVHDCSKVSCDAPDVNISALRCLDRPRPESKSIHGPWGIYKYLNGACNLGKAPFAFELYDILEHGRLSDHIPSSEGNQK